MQRNSIQNSAKKVELYQKAASMKYEEAELLTEPLSKGNAYLKVANCYIKAIEFHPDYYDTTELHDQAGHFLNKAEELVQ